MKAEQRKELETNALADRMGHLVQRVKIQPRRTAMYWVVGAAVIFTAVFLVIRYFQVSSSENSKRWVGLEIGARSQHFPEIPGLDELDKLTDGNQSKAARFQYAWFFYWERGVKRLGIDGAEAMKALNAASLFYAKLAEECADDPILQSEAMYALAVIEETRAVQDTDHLKDAKAKYAELAEKHKDTARGKLADQWVKNYDDAAKFGELQRFYIQMHGALNIPDPIVPKKGFDFSKGLKKDTKQPK